MDRAIGERKAEVNSTCSSRGGSGRRRDLLTTCGCPSSQGLRGMFSTIVPSAEGDPCGRANSTDSAGGRRQASAGLLVRDLNQTIAAAASSATTTTAITVVVAPPDPPPPVRAVKLRG